MRGALRIVKNASLRERNTFGVEAHAPWLVEVADTRALPEAFALPQLHGAPPLLLGGGSNLLFAGDPAGAVLSLRANATRMLEDDGSRALIRAEAGGTWHDLVMWSLAHGLCGLENLALIPGTVGAAPIQNIGAYGTEVGEFVRRVEAWDRVAGRFVVLDADACGFAYRDSVFKHEPDRHFVVAVEFALHRQGTPRIGYAGLPEELAAMGIDAPTPRDVAEAVMRVRRRKLPDPAVLGNAGSFFKNPIIPVAQADALLATHPGMPSFRSDSESTRKLSAAWLIDRCGWKGFRDGDAGVSAAHALVLVNHGRATGAQLLALARRIAASVQDRFGVAMEPEPKLVGASW